MNVGAVLEEERQAKPDLTGVGIVLSHQGDSRFMWSKHNPDEVAAAKKQFNDLKKKGHIAYRVDGDNGNARGEVIREFDPDAEALIMAPAPVGG